MKRRAQFKQNQKIILSLSIDYCTKFFWVNVFMGSTGRGVTQPLYEDSLNPVPSASAVGCIEFSAAYSSNNTSEICDQHEQQHYYRALFLTCTQSQQELAQLIKCW